MANEQLGIYLNNHLTASTTVLELLSLLEDKETDTDVARFASELHTEIKAEQQKLQEVMERLEITKSKPRQVIGRLGEIFTQLKLKFDDPKDGPLYHLEAFEFLLVSIEGKRGLWSALAHAAVPGFEVSEYVRLAKQSEEQKQYVENFRLAAAQRTFTP